MHATDFGRTLIIANPAAQSGAAREVAERLQRFLDMTARASQFDLVLTERMGHAKELAAQAQGYRTVIALGGDGVIHEVVNGLMKQKQDARPALAVLPVGSGNDFAQTLGIDDFSGKDFGALLTCELQHQDIGRIRSWNPASGSGKASVEYYDQTLSVGIDAAIGLGTTELRKKTGLTGAPLYIPSGITVTARESRSQFQNRSSCLRKLRAELERRGRPPRRRVKTKVPQRSRQRRLNDKHFKAIKKANRRKPGSDE